MHGEREFNFVFFTDGNIMGFQKLTCSLIICLLHFQKGFEANRDFKRVV